MRIGLMVLMRRNAFQSYGTFRPLWAISDLGRLHE